MYHTLRLFLLRLYQNTLLLQQLAQLAILMHRNQYIAPAHKLLVDIELRYGRPIRVLLYTYIQKSAYGQFT